MSTELGEIYDGMRAAGQQRRASNRQTTPALLAARGVPFEAKNDGAHLVVRYAGKTADLWPGTGKYCIRGTDRYCRGVFNLLHDLGVKAQAAAPRES